MTLKQITILSLSIIVVSSVLKASNAESIRLCGRRLADILNFICEKQGGFHAPRVRRNVIPKSEGQKPVEDILRSLVRRNDPSVATSELSGAEFTHQRGVVDECCKKECTLATLVSYCANARNIENIDINEILSSGMENLPIISETGLSQAALSNHDSSAGHQKSHSGRLVHSRPNLGLSNRNRSVFIVLSQLQEDEDKALGEYRF